MAHRAYVGLGANLGDARRSIDIALAALDALPGTALRARSALYRSAPVDAGGPDYLNAVAELDTSLDARPLLQAMQRIEIAQGRERPFRHAPRTLDLDLLLFDDRRCEDAQLTLPHPRLHLRAFVLQPLAELAPKLEIPGRGPIADWCARAGDQRIERLAD